METLQKMKRLGNVIIADGSTAMYFCHMACGRNRGMITFAKDVFPSIVSSLIVREAGGVFTNGDGDATLKPVDRIFIAGSVKSHALLLQTIL